MTTRIEIDLNVRVRGNDTYAGFEDVSGPLAVGDMVEVYEPESGLVGEGHITEIDTASELVFLSVDWATLAEPAESRVEVAKQISVPGVSVPGLMEKAMPAILRKTTTLLAGQLGSYVLPIALRFDLLVPVDVRWSTGGTTAIATWFDGATATFRHQIQGESPAFGWNSADASAAARLGKFSAAASPWEFVTIAQPGAELDDRREVAA